MLLLLIADTHLPRRAKDLPTRVWDEVDRADLVVHAGDWTEVSLLDRLRERAGAVVGVWGNNDGQDLRARLPEVAHIEVAGVRLAVVHETGAATGREARCLTRFPDADVVVFGHSHIPWDSTVARTDGSSLRLLNPGSPTDRRRQPACSYLTATVADGAVMDVALRLLPPRGA